MINDPELDKKIARSPANLQTITQRHRRGQRYRWANWSYDDTLYTRANSAVDQARTDHHRSERGKGTAGKLLKDETLYNNLNAAVANTEQLVAEINAGKGAWASWPRIPLSRRSWTTP